MLLPTYASSINVKIGLQQTIYFTVDINVRIQHCLNIVIVIVEIIVFTALSEVSTREYNMACYLAYYPVLAHHVQVSTYLIFIMDLSLT